jgi:hypothetical protein
MLKNHRANHEEVMKSQNRRFSQAHTYQSMCPPPMGFKERLSAMYTFLFNCLLKKRAAEKL